MKIRTPNLEQIEKITTPQDYVKALVVLASQKTTGRWRLRCGPYDVGQKELLRHTFRMCGGDEDFDFTGGGTTQRRLERFASGIEKILGCPVSFYENSRTGNPIVNNIVEAARREGCVVTVNKSYDKYLRGMFKRLVLSNDFLNSLRVLLRLDERDYHYRNPVMDCQIELNGRKFWVEVDEDQHFSPDRLECVRLYSAYSKGGLVKYSMDEWDRLVDFYPTDSFLHDCKDHDRNKYQRYKDAFNDTAREVMAAENGIGFIRIAERKHLSIDPLIDILKTGSVSEEASKQLGVIMMVNVSLPVAS